MKTPIVEHFEHELTFLAQRSRGPGGQNVNKTNSSVQLRWAFEESFYLDDEQKAQIRRKLANQINVDGILYLRSDTHRDQEANKRETMERLQKALTTAFHRPKPRRPTKPTKGSKVRNRAKKEQRSEVKKGRQSKWI